MGLNLDQINKKFYEKISKGAKENAERVAVGIETNKVLKELESHDTENKEKFSTHEPTEENIEEDKEKIKRLKIKTETWTQYLKELSTINTNASSVIEAIEQEHFNLSELLETPETKKVKKDLEDLIREYEKKRSIRKQETDDKVIKKIMDEIADMQK